MILRKIFQFITGEYCIEFKSGDGNNEFIEIDFSSLSIPGKHKCFNTRYQIQPIRVRNSAWESKYRNNRELRGAQWVWANKRLSQDETNSGSSIIYSRYFRLPQDAKEVNLHTVITADNKFEFFFNDSSMKIGQDWEQLAIQDISTNFRVGHDPNHIKIIAENYSGADPFNNPAGLTFRGLLTYKTRSLLGRTSEAVENLKKTDSVRLALLVIGPVIAVLGFVKDVLGIRSILSEIWKTIFKKELQ